MEKISENKQARNSGRSDELNEDNDDDEEVDLFPAHDEGATSFRGGGVASCDEQLDQLEVSSLASFAPCGMHGASANDSFACTATIRRCHRCIVRYAVA